MVVRIINADVLDGLGQLPDESVHCVVTSPPYWGLRDYGVEGQIGLEATPEAFVTRLVDVFREVRRILRSDGTCWLNLGDSYAAGGVVGRKDTTHEALRRRAERFGSGVGSGSMVGAGAAKPFPKGLKPKDLIGIPWRAAFALQADGWWLRSDIIWAKPNPMPESVLDRPTKAHEYVFLLTKSATYFYDAESIKEPAIYAGSTGCMSGPKNAARAAVQGRAPSGNEAAGAGRITVADTRNKRSVWSISTLPYADAHFATMPPDLAETCIKAGCPVGGTVMDPFSGAGTTALVADRLQRSAIGIELNPEYVAMSERRISADRGGGLLDLMETAE